MGLVQLLVGGSLLGTAAQAADAPAPPPQSDEAVLNGLRADIDGVQKALRGPIETIDLARLRTTALAAQSTADATAARLAPSLAGVEARLTEIGPATPGKPDPPDLAAQRAQLDKSRGTFDAQIKLAKLLSVESEQEAEQIWTLRRSQFQARLGERTSSILGKSFWVDLSENLPDDAHRAAGLGRDVFAASAGTRWTVWVGVIAGMAAVIAARMVLGRWLLRLTSTRVPAGRLRRSVHALVVVVLSAAAPALLAWLLDVAIGSGGSLAPATEAVISSFVGVACFGGFVGGLGHALFSPDRPSWRLPPIPDPVALRLRWLPNALAAASVVNWLALRLPGALNASLETAVAVKYIVSLFFGVIILVALMHSEHLRRVAKPQPGQPDEAPRPPWVSAIAGFFWLVLAVTVVCLLAGYVALGGFILQQVVWIVVVTGVAYLLAVLTDDICMLLTTRQAAQGDQPARTSTLRDQSAVLLSGVLRIAIGALALMLIAAPFGAGPSEMFRRVGQLFDGVAIGEVQVRPSSVLQAVGLLVLGLVGVRLLKRWLSNSYFPTTGLDPGMRASATSLFGYAGVVLVVALALSAVGIGLERVAWVASALSVGIGFGLQAVVQNFVSGLILLAERPVKVGDWVSLGGVEGDIRRINVRATEIQMGDRSTVIVPNSEFITKTVRNVTMADPIGLVQIKLPMPLDTDVMRVQALLQSAFEAHTDVLDDPAPSVALDGIENGALVFNATGFVASPRMTYGVRSSLLFDILKSIRGAGLAMSKPPTMLLANAAAASPGLPGSTGPAVAPAAPA